MDYLPQAGFVDVAVFSFLAATCILCWFGIRRMEMLGWLGMGLAVGATEIYALATMDATRAELLIVGVLLPIAYSCINRAARTATADFRHARTVDGLVLGLSVLSLVLLHMRAPFLAQTLPFQLACGIALGDAAVRIARASQKAKIDRTLAVLLGITAGVFLIRLPLFPALFDWNASYVEVKTSMIEQVLLMASALCSPPIVLLFAARCMYKEIALHRQRAERDYLTGLMNRRSFDQVVDREAAGGGAVICCDLDHFKCVNDHYGHSIGDEVIRAFAILLQGTGYSASRLGGEEFAMILHGRSATEALVMAEKLRRAFRELRLPGIAPDHTLTASFGVAEYDAEVPLAKALMLADAALYRAKADGRDRVACHSGAEGAGAAAQAGKVAA